MAEAKEAKQAKGSASTDGAPRIARLRGVVTAFSGWKNSFFLQDATGGISVEGRDQTAVNVGDEVEVKGSIQTGAYAPVILAGEARILGKGQLPRAPVPTSAELDRGAFDSRRIQLEGVVRSARAATVWGRRVLVLRLQVGELSVSVHVLDFAGWEPRYLIESRVRVTGVCGTIFNDRRQMTGVRIFVPDLTGIQIERQGPDPFQLPLTPLKDLLTFDEDARPDDRIHVSGIVTYQAAGVIFLEDGLGSVVRVRSSDREVFPLGTRLEAAGFFSTRAAIPNIRDAVLLKAGSARPLVPVHIDASAAIRERDGFRFALYDGRLVQMEGEVSERPTQTGTDVFLVRQGSAVFRAELDNPSGRIYSAIASGTLLSLTGICVVDYDEGRSPRSFHLLLRTERDVTVLRTPFWTLARLLPVTVFLFLFSSVVVIWMLQRSQLGGPVEKTDDAGANSSPSLYDRSHRYLGAAVSCTGAAVVMGWILDIQFLKSVGAGYPAMAEKTAVLLVFAGLALWLEPASDPPGSVRRSQIALACGGLVGALALVTLVAQATGWSVGADHWMLAGGDPAAHGAMPPFTAAAFLIWAAAFGLLRLRSCVVAGQLLAIVNAFLNLFVFVCYLYDFHSLQSMAVIDKMAVHSAISFILLSAALPLRDYRSALMRPLADAGPGSTMARQMLPAALLVPAVVGWLAWQGHLARLYDAAFSVAIFASANMVAFTFLVWNSAVILREIYLARSITKRALEASEDSLRRRDEHLELIFEQGSVGDWTLDFDTELVHAHSSVWALWGEQRGFGSAPVSWFLSRVHPDDRPPVVDALASALKEGAPYDVEFRVLRPDGTIRCVRSRGAVARNGGGRTTHLHGVNVDVTDTKGAEAALHESKLQFRLLANAMPQIVWVSGADGRSVYFNDRWYEFSGFERSDGGFESWLLLVHPDDARMSGEAWLASMQSGRPFEMECRLWDRSSRAYRWFLGRAALSAGGTALWFGTATDIHEFKRAQMEILALNGDLETRVAERTAELFESEQRLRLMVEGVNDYAIFMLDCDGNVASWNIGAERLNGYTEAEVVGRHFSMFYRAEDARNGLPERELEKARKTGQFYEEGERECVRADGSFFWASVRITPVYGPTGEPRGFSTIIRDVTDFKKAIEAARGAREQAESANRAKSDFLARMSHEIRTPMNLIMGMNALLLEDNLNARQRKHIEISDRNVRRLLRLINTILDLSKVEAGKLSLEVAPFSLSEVLDETVATLSAAVEQKGLRLFLKVAPGMWPYRLGDSERLQQVLLNLVGNSIKFTAAGSICLRVQPRDGKSGGEWVRFEVSDTGCGIPKGKEDLIFHPFRQADGAMNRTYEGTGLGLSITKNLVEMMGGRIWVEPREGPGATVVFTARFPRATEKRVNARLEDSRTVTQARGLDPGTRILIAEDNEENLFLLHSYLEGQPVIVDTAPNGLEALRKRKENQYDLILMDIQMSVMDGLAATRAIRAWEQEHDSARMPIVALTAHALTGAASECQEAGCDGYLSKPVQRGDLVQTIIRFAARREVRARPSGSDGIGSRQPRSLANRGDDIRAMRTALEHSDFDAIGRIAHDFEDSGISCGFPEISSLAKALELAASQRDTREIAARIAELDEFVDSLSAA